MELSGCSGPHLHVHHVQAGGSRQALGELGLAGSVQGWAGKERWLTSLKGTQVIYKMTYTSGRQPGRMCAIPVILLATKVCIGWSSDHISFDKQG